MHGEARLGGNRAKGNIRSRPPIANRLPPFALASGRAAD